MTFEDAVQVVHDLSTKLAQLVDIKGDLVMEAERTTRANFLQSKVYDLSDDITFLLSEFESAKERIQEELTSGS